MTARYFVTDRLNSIAMRSLGGLTKMWLILSQGSPDIPGAQIHWHARLAGSVVGPDTLPWTNASLVKCTKTEIEALHISFEAYPLSENAAVNFIRPLMLAGGLLRTFFEPGALTLQKLREHELAHEAPGDAAVNPTDAQINRLLESTHAGPVWMINLLRYRQTAKYSASSRYASNPVSGKEAYLKYGRVALRSVALLGGEAMVAGDLGQPVRNADFPQTFGEWHELAIVCYPTPQSLLKLVFMPGYTEATEHRTAALEDTRLIMTTA